MRQVKLKFISNFMEIKYTISIYSNSTNVNRAETNNQVFFFLMNYLQSLPYTPIWILNIHTTGAMQLKNWLKKKKRAKFSTHVEPARSQLHQKLTKIEYKG